MDEQDDGQSRRTDLDVTWGFHSHACLQQRSQKTPPAGDAGDRHACLQQRLQEAPVYGDAGDEIFKTMDSSQGGAVDARSVPASRTGTVETMGSSQGGAVDASSVRAGRAESGSDASAAFGTDHGNGDGPPAVLSDKEAPEIIS